MTIYIPQVKPTKMNRDHDKGYWSRKVNITCNTNGKGLWSRSQRKINHKKIEINTFCDNFSFYELRVFFNKKDWNVDKHGLVYTDPLWIKEFRQGLVNMGFSKASVKDCDYSEQGMQSDDYISLDASPKFAKEFFSKLYQ